MTTARYRGVKGTRDLLPPESERWDAAERLTRDLFRSYGYGEIRTPALEDTALFARSVGETTDLVHKEMYTFPDRKGRSLTLRPENTAGVVRAIVENGAAAGPMPLRLYYIGSQFRYERPQAGRYREFRQIGAELFGVPGPEAEAELLAMLFDLLRGLGFQSLSVGAELRGVGGNARVFRGSVAFLPDDAVRRLRRGRPAQAGAEPPAPLRFPGPGGARGARGGAAGHGFPRSGVPPAPCARSGAPLGGRRSPPRGAGPRARTGLLHADRLRGHLPRPLGAGRDPRRGPLRPARRVARRPRAARRGVRHR